MIRLLLLLVISSLFWAAGCNGPCKEEVWATSKSPDGKYQAETISKDCGATTTEVLRIVVHPSNRRRGGTEDNALVLKHGDAVSLNWLNSTTLQVSCHECITKEVMAKADRVGSVHIAFDLPQ